MKIKESTLLKALLFLILVGCENTFYLINADQMNIAGVFNYQDIYVVLAFLFIVIVFIKYGRVKCQFRFKWVILSIIPIALIASYQSLQLYGQSFIMGIRPQRFWIMWALLYFPIRRMMEAKKLTVDDLIKMTYIIGTVEIILFSTQYFLGRDHQFLYVGVTLRYGTDRYYFHNTLLVVLLFICLDRIFQKKKVIFNGIYIALILFVLLEVGKMRMTSLATALAMMFGILLWRRGGKTKIGVLIAVVVASILLFNTSIVQDTLTTLLEFRNDSVSATSTLAIRQYGRALYFSNLAKHPILGCGYISSLSYTASAAAGFYDNVFLSDNGLYAFAFMYGGIGVAWVIWLFASLLKYGWNTYRERGIQFMLLVPLSWLIAGQTEAHWYFNNGFICVVLILVVLEECLRTEKSDVVSLYLENKKKM